MGLNPLQHISIQRDAIKVHFLLQPCCRALAKSLLNMNGMKGMGLGWDPWGTGAERGQCTIPNSTYGLLLQLA